MKTKTIYHNIIYILNLCSQKKTPIIFNKLLQVIVSVGVGKPIKRFSWKQNDNTIVQSVQKLFPLFCYNYLHVPVINNLFYKSYLSL